MAARPPLPHSPSTTTSHEDKFANNPAYASVHHAANPQPWEGNQTYANPQAGEGNDTSELDEDAYEILPGETQ